MTIQYHKYILDESKALLCKYMHGLFEALSGLCAMKNFNLAPIYVAHSRVVINTEISHQLSSPCWVSVERNVVLIVHESRTLTRSIVQTT